MKEIEFVNETLGHIRTVGMIIKRITDALFERAIKHDASKLKDPEYSVFLEFTPKLKGSTFGSEEYKKYLEAMGAGLQHHYANNYHHPECEGKGIKGMTLVDLIEMVCDWKAATLRHADGDMFKSIEIQQKKLGFDDTLKQILINTVCAYFSDIKQETTESK